MNLRFKLILLIGAILIIASGCQQNGVPAEGPAALGQELFNQIFIGDNQAPGCVTCHSVEPNEKSIGPSLAGIGTNSEEQLRMDIVEPAAELTEGYGNVMYPNYAEVLSEEQINALIDYLKTLK